MTPGALFRTDNRHCVLPRVRKTATLFERMRGLLARPPLARDEGLLITHCNSVHTVGMGYAIDLVYLDRRGTVLKQVSNLKPWRLSRCGGACMTLELLAGTLDALDLAAGSRLEWQDA